MKPGYPPKGKLVQILLGNSGFFTEPVCLAHEVLAQRQRYRLAGLSSHQKPAAGSMTTDSAWGREQYSACNRCVVEQCRVWEPCRRKQIVFRRCCVYTAVMIHQSLLSSLLLRLHLWNRSFIGVQFSVDALQHFCHPGSPREEERQQKLLDLRVHSKSVSKLGLPFDATQPSQSRRLA